MIGKKDSVLYMNPSRGRKKKLHDITRRTKQEHSKHGKGDKTRTRQTEGQLSTW